MKRSSAGIQQGESMKVLTRGDVARCLEGLDVVDIVENALRLHEIGGTVVPPEAYMPWENSQKAYCRSLAMPGALGEVLGLKLINAAVSNPAAGIPRAGGFTVLFDYETGRPNLLAEGALISALRTAAYTMSSLRHLGPEVFTTVAMIGCGNLARVHADLLSSYFPDVVNLRLFDVDSKNAEGLAESWKSDPARTASVHASAQEALAGAGVVIILTTSSTPYIDASSLSEEAFVAHVSLGDLKGDVFTGARAIYVDDLELVEDNPRRILGALIRDGAVARNGEDPRRPHIAGTLGAVLSGKAEAIRPAGGRVVSNPFGMSILDLALLKQVARAADAAGAGIGIDLSDARPVTSQLIQNVEES